MTKTDLAWAAGIIDGEGSIFIQKGDYTGKVYPKGKRRIRREKSPTYVLRLAVKMVDQPTIQRLSELFDGKCLLLNRRTVMNRKVYSWSACGYKALEILQKICPYATTKKNQIQVAKNFMSIPRFQNGKGPGSKLPKSITNRRESCYRKMKSFNYGSK